MLENILKKRRSVVWKHVLVKAECLTFQMPDNGDTRNKDIAVRIHAVGIILITLQENFSRQANNSS